MNSAIKDNNVTFNMLHKKCGERLEYIRYCPHCKKEVKTSEIEKGYEFSKDEYITLTDEDFEKLKSENDKVLEIIAFVNISEINGKLLLSKNHMEVTIPEFNGYFTFMTMPKTGYILMFK